MGRAARAFLITLSLAGCGERDDEPESGGPPDDPGYAMTTYSNGHPLNWISDHPPTLSKEEELLALVNDHRVSLGQDALVHDRAMRECARGHSRHMRGDVHFFYAHVNPEGDSPAGRLFKNGVFSTAAGENLVAARATALEAFSSWMDSPGHRKNMEDGRWSRTGVGYQPGTPSPGYSSYWTQVFAD